MHKKMWVEFMKRKAEIVKEYCSVPYLVTEDIEAIEEIDEKILKKEWEKMKKHLEEHKEYWLGRDTCIFCRIYYPYCNNCPYSKNHGECGRYCEIEIDDETLFIDEMSEWDIILHWETEDFDDYSVIYEILNRNNVKIPFKDIIKEIEQKYIGENNE